MAVMVVWCWVMSDVSVIFHLCVIAVIICGVSHHLIMIVFTTTRSKSVNLSKSFLQIKYDPHHLSQSASHEVQCYRYEDHIRMSLKRLNG